MATGREMQLTKRVGEYLVCAELSRMGFVATTFSGNVPEFDILAINDKRRTKPIQVKAIKGGSWQFDISRFLDISISSDGMQVINGKKELENPHLICVFVKLVSQGKDEFYIFELKNLQDIIFRNHSGWLKKHGGKRPRNPKSMHGAVSPHSLLKHRDNWGLLRA
ncbi:hypothetical protein ACFLWY_03545 [Chloroflexota bacterium]